MLNALMPFFAARTRYFGRSVLLSTSIFPAVSSTIKIVGLSLNRVIASILGIQHLLTDIQGESQILQLIEC